MQLLCCVGDGSYCCALLGPTAQCSYCCDLLGLAAHAVVPYTEKGSSCFTTWGLGAAAGMPYRRLGDLVCPKHI